MVITRRVSKCTSMPTAWSSTVLLLSLQPAHGVALGFTLTHIIFACYNTRQLAWTLTLLWHGLSLLFPRLASTQGCAERLSSLSSYGSLARSVELHISYFL
ncbi:hypothetical protein CPB85DRAFT_1332098 [Mucidula mucida]|nr:hypothetical protein CPB85DRAFT_1332098 [Mucidula mucida]